METIKDDAKKSIVGLLNKSLQVEYDFLFGYPRVIDKLVNIDKINDKQIIDTIETLIKESQIHFDEIDKFVRKCGCETIWNINVVDWSVDVEECLIQLLDKENWVISWYQAAKRVANQNKVKTGNILSRLTEGTDILPEDFIDVNELVSMFDRHIAEEEKHISLCEGSINRLRMLKNK